MRKWAKRLGLLVVVALIFFIFGWVPYFLAGLATTRRFTYNDKENAGMTPAKLGLTDEDVAFSAADGVPLKGW